jgi:flagellar L-ring protein precursor FlgH
MKIGSLAMGTALILATMCSMTHAQNLRDNLSRSLFADQKANRAGDAVTILVIEESSASNDSKSTMSRESQLSLSGSVKTGAASAPEGAFSLGTGNSFKGAGNAQSNGSVRAKISARVDSVLPNGNMFISGSRNISVNGDEQIIKITGIIRPTDVQADNSVYSYNISEATILFEGSGMVDRSRSPGWLTKLFHWLF